MSMRRIAFLLLCTPPLVLSVPALASAAQYQESASQAGPNGASHSSISSESGLPVLADIGVELGVINIDAF